MVDVVTAESAKRFWENLTVFLTVASAFLACIGLAFSHWEEKGKQFKVWDKSLSIIGAIVAISTALALAGFTHFSRIVDKTAQQQVDAAATDARTAISGLGEEERRLSETQHALATTSHDAAVGIIQLKTALQLADLRLEENERLGRVIQSFQVTVNIDFPVLRGSQQFDVSGESDELDKRNDRVICGDRLFWLKLLRIDVYRREPDAHEVQVAYSLLDPTAVIGRDLSTIRNCGSLVLSASSLFFKLRQLRPADELTTAQLVQAHFVVNGVHVPLQARRMTPYSWRSLFDGSEGIIGWSLPKPTRDLETTYLEEVGSAPNPSVEMPPQ